MVEGYSWQTVFFFFFRRGWWADSICTPQNCNHVVLTPPPFSPPPIFGCSGSGKTTLLKILSGRLTDLAVGCVAGNGLRADEDHFRCLTALVPQVRSAPIGGCCCERSDKSARARVCVCVCVCRPSSFLSFGGPWDGLGTLPSKSRHSNLLRRNRAQEDVMYPTLTVRSTLGFLAALGNENEKNPDGRNAVVRRSQRFSLSDLGGCKASCGGDV